MRQLVLAALLAVDDEVRLLEREHGVDLAVEPDREAVGHERIGQHDVVSGDEPIEVSFLSGWRL